jgi:hypothetical protein
VEICLQLSSLADRIKFRRWSRDVMAQAPHVGAVMGPLFPMFHLMRAKKSPLHVGEWIAVSTGLKSKRELRNSRAIASQRE